MHGLRDGQPASFFVELGREVVGDGGAHVVGHDTRARVAAPAVNAAAARVDEEQVLEAEVLDEHLVEHARRERHDRPTSVARLDLLDVAVEELVVGQVDVDVEGEVEAVTLASRGEPLMCRNIKEMLEYLRGKFLGLKMNTNAWFLTEELAHTILQTGLNTLVFSVDAAEPELYARLRVNGKLERVLENIKMFSEVRRKHYPDSRLITRTSGVHFSDEQDFDKMQEFWSEFVDQVAFVDYNPRNSDWEYALYLSLILIMIGLMGEFYTRKHASESWSARR